MKTQILENKCSELSLELLSKNKEIIKLKKEIESNEKNSYFNFKRIR